MALGDFRGVIPPEQAARIIQEATRASAALSLGQVIPMGTQITNLPVPKTLPTASFVTAATGRKPYSDIGMKPETLTAEEIACVVAIPDAMIEDSSINLWNWARPMVAQAIAVAVDNAAFFGTGAPTSWPVGGINAAVNSGAPVTPTVDAVETINFAMGAVEARGLVVTGHAADTGNRYTMRGVRDGNGALLLGTTQVNGYEQPSLYGLPLEYTQLGTLTAVDFFTGAWEYLVMGMRSDVRYELDPGGVIVDNAGVVQVSGFQDNVTPMKVWTRIGCVIIRPVTPRSPAGAIPFAKAKLIGASYGPPASEPPGSEDDAGSSRSHAKK